jgi:hypothetical protein
MTVVNEVVAAEPVPTEAEIKALQEFDRAVKEMRQAYVRMVEATGQIDALGTALNSMMAIEGFQALMSCLHEKGVIDEQEIRHRLIPRFAQIEKELREAIPSGLVRAGVSNELHRRRRG